MVAAPRFGAQDQRRRLAHELIPDCCRRRIDAAMVAVLAAGTAFRRMALSKRTWLERAVIFGRVCAAQRRWGSRHFHGFGVVALGVEACMWDMDQKGLVSKTKINLWAAIEISRRFDLLCAKPSRVSIAKGERGLRDNVNTSWRRSENSSRQFPLFLLFLFFLLFCPAANGRYFQLTERGQAERKGQRKGCHAKDPWLAMAGRKKKFEALLYLAWSHISSDQYQHSERLPLTTPKPRVTSAGERTGHSSATQR